MLPAESENDALTDERTDGRMLKRNFLNGRYNVKPALFKVAGYENSFTCRTSSMQRVKASGAHIQTFF